MDRRDFLKSTGAVAVAATSAGTAAQAGIRQPLAAPAILADAQQLTLASTWGPDMARPNAERLARSIETATGGRFKIETVAGARDADMTFGAVHDLAARHPAFVFFAGLPRRWGLDAAALPIWLAAGGGQMLWDELAADFGFKPLLAGHTGPSAGLWTNRRLETMADLAGAKLFVTGLARNVVASLGATPVASEPQDMRAALASGRLDGAEWLGPLAAASPDLQPLAQRLYAPALNIDGAALALVVRRDRWERMSATDKAIFEGVAAQEYAVSLADAWAHRLIAREVAAPLKWPARQPLPDAIGSMFDTRTAIALGEFAVGDPVARRIHDSHAVFRDSLVEAPSV